MRGAGWLPTPMAEGRFDLRNRSTKDEVLDEVHAHGPVVDR
jgi:hypothetical protein